jgi:hypothetical protein
MLHAPLRWVNALAATNAPGGWRARIKMLRRARAS